MKSTNKGLDKQAVGVVGKHRLVEELLRAGFEVAEPVRDRGIDLIVYSDFGKTSKFVATPIQIKSASKKSFGIHKKYAKFPNLLIAYVWNLSQSDNSATTYCMSYKEAVEIARKMGYTKNPSWKTKDSWAVTNPGKELISLMEHYKMTSPKWCDRIISRGN